METLTARQSQTLEFLRRFTAEHGFAPTYREIATGMGIKHINSVRNLLRTLERKGAISQVPRAARGLRLLDHTTPADMALMLRAFMYGVARWKPCSNEAGEICFRGMCYSLRTARGLPLLSHHVRQKLQAAMAEPDC